jgi:hypothetical protein
MTDYLLLTFVQTWWEEVLRQLVFSSSITRRTKLFLAVCAKKARSSRVLECLRSPTTS